MLVLHPAVPAKSLAELIARAKANPGKINYASGGIGSSPHLAAELLKKEAKINIAHVPYKGTGLAMKDLVAGYVQMMFPSVSPVKEEIESGKLRALAVTTLKRTALLPERALGGRARDPELRGDRLACAGRPRQAAQGRGRDHPPGHARRP